MKTSDIFLALIVIGGILILTYVYTQDRPPSLTIDKQYSDVEIVAVSGGGHKCTVLITKMKEDYFIYCLLRSVYCLLLAGAGMPCMVSHHCLLNRYRLER